MDLLTYLEENSKIDSIFIEDFFEYYEYNQYYIDLENVMKWCKVENKEEYKKNVIEKYKEEIDYVKRGDKILLNALTFKLAVDDNDIRNKFFELEHLANKYNKYRIRKLKRQVKMLKKSLEENNKVVINTIKNINDVNVEYDEPIEYRFRFENFMKWLLIGMIVGRVIYIIYSCCSLCSGVSKCESKLDTAGNIFKYIVIFILVIKIVSLICSSFIISNISKKMI
jgi:hypothetical protein